MTQPSRALTLTLLNDLHHTTRSHMHRAGITSLEQIASMTVEMLCTFHGVGQTKARYFHAQATAYVESRPVWINSPPPVCHHPAAWFFDIETDPYTQQVWSIGWCDPSGDVRIVIVDPILSESVDQGAVIRVPNGDEAWRTLAEAVGTDSAPIFHWSPFDASVMRRFAPEEVTAALNARMHDLCAIFKRTVQIPARGVSIKVVARYFGFDWSQYDDWQAAWNDYQAWQRTRVDDDLLRACAYQGDDVRAMVIVWRWLQQALT